MAERDLQPVKDRNRTKILIAAGWKYVDGYIFPCHKSGCPSPATQVANTVNHLKSVGAEYGMLWLDIETQDVCCVS